MTLKERLKNPYTVLAIVFIYTIAFAFIVDTPQNIFDGIIAIIESPDVLLTDYVAVGGVGATLVNSALVCLLIIGFLKLNKVQPIGSTVMAIWTVAGFAFFGKNILNIWPIIIGVWLCALIRKVPYSKYAAMSMLSTAMSPIVSKVFFQEFLPFPISFIAAVFVGVLAGLIVAPIAENATLSHHGYNLYHIGFTSGLIAIIMRAVFLSAGFDIAPVLYWSSESFTIMLIYTSIACVMLILIGLYTGSGHKKKLPELISRSGRLASDYYTDYGETCYINMGALGIIAIIISSIVSMNINGPIAGGIFTIVGFGAFGLHLKNAGMVLVGLLFGFILVNMVAPNETAILAVLFGTCLAPVAGSFGFKWGVAAGILHVFVATNITDIHGGMNLYSNGLAGGLIIMFFIPLVRAIAGHEGKA